MYCLCYGLLAKVVSQFQPPGKQYRNIDYKGVSAIGGSVCFP